MHCAIKQRYVGGERERKRKVKEERNVKKERKIKEERKVKKENQHPEKGKGRERLTSTVIG